MEKLSPHFPPQKNSSILHAMGKMNELCERGFYLQYFFSIGHKGAGADGVAATVGVFVFQVNIKCVVATWR